MCSRIAVTTVNLHFGQSVRYRSRTKKIVSDCPRLVSKMLEWPESQRRRIEGDQNSTLRSYPLVLPGCPEKRVEIAELG